MNCKLLQNAVMSKFKISYSYKKKQQRARHVNKPPSHTKSKRKKKPTQTAKMRKTIPRTTFLFSVFLP